MSFQEQLNNLRELKNQINQLAPRNSEGNLSRPYRKFIQNIDLDIEQAEKYLRSVNTSTPITALITTERPQNQQETPEEVLPDVNTQADDGIKLPGHFPQPRDAENGKGKRKKKRAKK